MSCYKKWAHGIVEAEKSCNLQSARWRPQRAGDVVPVRIWRLVVQESQTCTFQPQSLRPGEERCPSISSWQRESAFSCLSPFLFYSCHPVFRVLLCCSVCQNFIPFYGQIIVHYVDRLHFLYRFISQWTFGLFPLPASWQL